MVAVAACVAAAHVLLLTAVLLPSPVAGPAKVPPAMVFTFAAVEARVPPPPAATVAAPQVRESPPVPEEPALPRQEARPQRKAAPTPEALPQREVYFGPDALGLPPTLAELPGAGEVGGPVSRGFRMLLRIDARGAVREAFLERYEIDEDTARAVEEAFRHARFHPGQREGQPAPAEVRVQVCFDERGRLDLVSQGCLRLDTGERP